MHLWIRYIGMQESDVCNEEQKARGLYQTKLQIPNQTKLQINLVTQPKPKQVSRAKDLYIPLIQRGPALLRKSSALVKHGRLWLAATGIKNTWKAYYFAGFTGPCPCATPRVLISDRSPVPVRFGRLPVGTGRIQIWIQMAQFNRFVLVYRPVRPVYRPGWPVYRPGWLVTGQIQFFFFFDLNSNARKVY